VRILLALAFLAAAAPLAPRPASAQADGNANVAYQNALLSRSLSSDDQSFCASKAGSKDAQDACRVTRLFLADAAAGKDAGFPPLADIKYTTSKAEISRILDLMTKYGG